LSLTPHHPSSSRDRRPQLRRLLLTLVAGVVAAAAPVVAVASEAPTLLPGGSAVVKGAHVSCIVTSNSVSCTKAGGLTATLGQSGAVHVTKGSLTLFSTAQQHMQLHNNEGFVLAGSSAYCHVYVVVVPTLTCALTGAQGGAPMTHGFDISDRSVVVYRYDSKNTRHDIKTFPQR
jgi:hypothetical protein